MHMLGRHRQVLLVIVASLVARKYISLFTIDLSPLTSAALTTTIEISAPLKLPDVVQRSLSVREDPHNITVGLCHKALFGDINLWMVLDWVSYHKLLGFDHIFMSYIPEVRHLDGFKELSSLPYITLFEFSEGEVQVINDKGYHRLKVSPSLLNTTTVQQLNISEHQPSAQLLLEARCLDQHAHAFDWVMLSDADEYLWFNEKIGVKEFLQRRNNKYDYISLGKWMYTTMHRVNATTSGFNLENFPFTAGVYCTMQNKRGKPMQVCARMNGRAKVIVKPSVHHGHVRVHGNHLPRKRKESIHISANVAHFMEWNSATQNTATEPILRENKSFPIYSREEANMHGFHVFPKNNDSSVTLRYDDKLHGWFDFVASRGILV
jgi:hypothetical protein